MSTRGPSQVSSNGLVFYYDTFNEKSYFGKPTKNYCAFTPAYVNWNSQDITTTTISSEVLQIQSTSNVAVQAIWWSGFNPAGESNSGIKLSYSVYVRGKGSVSIQMHQANTSPNAAQDAVGSSTIVLDSNAWTRLSLTNIYMASGVTSCNILIYLTGGTGNYVQVKNVQIEFNDYPTQYVNGTRSVTNGLIDLIGNNTINLTNAGFDSSANLTFNGSSNYLNCGTGINLQQNFTLECWAYITGDSSGLFGQGITAGNQGLHILWNSQASRGMVFGMYGNDLDTTSFTLTFNRWYHFAFTYNHSTYLKQFYVNGVLTNSGTGAAYAGSGQFNVGATYSSALAPAKGKINAAAVYYRVLSASEILRNYNATKSRYGL